TAVELGLFPAQAQDVVVVDAVGNRLDADRAVLRNIDEGRREILVRVVERRLALQVVPSHGHAVFVDRDALELAFEWIFRHRRDAAAGVAAWSIAAASRV